MQKCTTNRITWIFIILGCISGVYGRQPIRARPPSQASQSQKGVDTREPSESTRSIPIIIGSKNESSIGDLQNLKSLLGFPTLQVYMKNKTIIPMRLTATLDSLAKILLQDSVVKFTSKPEEIELDPTMKIVDLFNKVNCKTLYLEPGSSL